jgi:hypothetical protein
MEGPENWVNYFLFLQLRETYLGTKHSPKTGRGKTLQGRELEETFCRNFQGSGSICVVNFGGENAQK